jgi:hypothetical protein
MRETQWPVQSPRPDKFHVESAIFYHRPAYSLKQSQICAFEKMLSLRLLLLQLLQCTLRVSATSPLEEHSPDRIFLPGQDWSVNRADLEHLVPNYSSRLMFFEEPQSSLAMSTTMTMMFPTIILVCEVRSLFLERQYGDPDIQCRSIREDTTMAWK